jgi:ribosomal protein S12 methylthiotransferase accessory factor
MPLLDGGRTVSELIERLSGTVSGPEVHFALARLAEHGCLSSLGREGQPEREAAYWRLYDVDSDIAAARLEAASVKVESAAEAERDAACRALAGVGLRTTDEPNSTVALLVVRDYLDPELSRLAAELRLAGRPILLVRPFGSEPWIGPLLVPAVDACHECLASRLRSQRVLHSYVASQLGGSLPLDIPIAALQGTVEIALRLAALELARWIVGAPQPTVQSNLLSLDLRLFAARRHRVVRRPQCPCCGDPGLIASRGWSPIRFVSRRKVWTLDNGYRDRDPETTLRQMAHHVSPITGVVRELRSVPGPGGDALRMFLAGPNVALPVRDAETLERREAAVSAGKGLTEAQAGASALCEAIERYSATFQGDEPRITASLLELGGQAIHPNAVQSFSQRQYREREGLNRALIDRRRSIPRPFDENAPLEWTPLWSLTGECVRYLPTACCYLGCGAPDFIVGDSNGVAAGNSHEEAVLHGFLELVERDGAAIWWYNRLLRPGVDLETFDEPRFELIREGHTQLGRSLWILDLTTDLGLPIYVAVSMAEQGTSAPVVALGFGAHLEPRVAAGRALTEVSQFLRLLQQSPPGSAARDWPAAAATATEERFLFPGPEPAKRSGGFLETKSDDLKTDVETCVALAARHGLETLVLDQTRPDIGLPVVRVVVPGLRHFWPRFGPGRLYDVPVRMGWLQEPRREEELNLYPTLF